MQVRDVVPAMLERDFNPHGQTFRTQFEPATPRPDPLPVEALLLLLADAGDQVTFFFFFFMALQSRVE